MNKTRGFIFLCKILTLAWCWVLVAFKGKPKGKKYLQGQPQKFVLRNDFKKKKKTADLVTLSKKGGRGQEKGKI